MRMRSTGLGKTELEAEIINIKKVDDLVIFFVDVTKPAKWKIRMGFQENDLKALILAILRPRNLAFVFKALLFGNREVPRTESF